jgi:uncharacterized protein YodC (DUF2158 family)
MCFPSIEDLAQRSDWPEIRAGLRAGLRQWAGDKGLMMDSEPAVTSDVMAGAIVYHKSGSPKLVVTGIKRTDGLITCQWFDGDTLCTESFEALALCFTHPNTIRLG